MNILKVTIAFSAIFFVAADKKTYNRAKPPTKWDKSTLSIFEDNAYSLLEGQKPNLVIQEDKKLENKKEEKADGDFDRTDMMKKMQRAEEVLAESLNSEKSFKAATSKIESSADLIIMMGRTMFNGDPDYSDDDYFLKQAEDMTISAKQIKALVKKGDYEAASRSFSSIKKNCDNCHQRFR